MFKFSTEAKKTIYIGVMCFLSYLAVYFARNILGAVTPHMLQDGTFTTEQIGTLSSIYFIVYAFGQLLNGMIGDKFKAKYMLGLGLALAGICNAAFALFSEHIIVIYISYGMTGFFLSMIYGPMAKIIAENLEGIYATRCSVGYTFASFLGSPLAGILAAVLVWQMVFFATSAALIIMGLLCFLALILYEKKGIVRYGEYVPGATGFRGLKTLLKHRLVRFTFVSVITGIARTTIVFWLPTYLSQYLGFSPDHSALLFTISTAVISSAAFVALIMYEKMFKYNMERTIVFSFAFAAVCFAGQFLITQPAVNIALMTLAILASDCAAAMMWTRYCPSLYETGLVSTVSGYLDFISYIAAAAASVIFANAVSAIGWNGLIIVWFALMIGGIFTMVPSRKRA